MRLFTSLTVLFLAFFINAMPGYGQEDLKIAVTASHVNADPGDEITYVIKYSNAGLTPASNVLITSQLPDLGIYTYVSSHPQGIISGNVITWDQSQIPELALLRNGECQIAVTVKAGVPGNGTTQFSSGYYIPSSTAILQDFATIKSNSTLTPVQSNVVSTTIVQHCNVHVNNASGVVKSATNTRVFYMIQVTNNGNVYDRYNLSSLNYDCDGPGGMGFESLIAEFTDLNGVSITKTDWIAPDQTYYFLLRLTVGPGTSPGRWSCHDVIATSEISGSTGVGKIQTQTEGAPHNPLVSISKIDDKDPVEAGEEFNYNIYAFNANDSYAATNFVIKETYPPNVTFISSTPAPDPGFDNQWSLGELEYGLAGAKTINIKMKANSLGNCSGNITNTVTASYDGYNASNPPSATVVTTIKSYPDLEITKTARSSSIPAKKGESITYTINYQNLGTCDAPNSQIKDLFDDVHTNIVSAGGGMLSGNEITWNLGTLAPGQSGTIIYTALIDPESTFNPGTTTLTNKATISTSGTENNYNNNTANANIPVSVLPDMKVEVFSGNSLLEPGKENTYTLKISNVGDIAASNVEIKDVLPTGLMIGFISDGGINLDGSVTWPVIATFGVGSSVEYQVKVTPSCSFVPSITSVASVTSSIIDIDDTNNSVTVSSIVQDITFPVLADVPSDVTTSCEDIPALGTPKATDNCDSAPVVHFLGEVSTRGTNPLMPDYYNFTLTRSWDATDASGNHSTPGTQVITVKDITPPVRPILPDITIGECSGTPIAPTTTDICKGTVTGTTSTIFPITQQGITVVTWTFDDGNGNTTTATQNVIVDDVSAPVADVPSLPVISGECSVTATAPSAMDNCIGSIKGTTTDPIIYSEQGTYTIHWTYDDGHGNTSSQTQTVVVDDTTPPEMPVLTDITVGECSGTPVAPTTEDNCTGTVTGTTSTIFPITQHGITVVTWTFDDGNGNVTTAPQHVIVDDVTAPVADVPSLPVISGECSVTATAPSAMDNCIGSIKGTTTDPIIYSEQGTYTIHWTYDDGHGNTSSQPQTVIVKDVTVPVTPVLAEVTIGECSGTPAAPTTNDNCAGIITGTTTTHFPITNQGPTIVEWTFDDGNGNTTTANQNVIVDDVSAPVADVPSLPVISGECSVTVTSPSATDNCKGLIIGATTDPLIYSVQGTYTIYWTYDDGNGNISTQTQTVIVDDTTPPVANLTVLPLLAGQNSVTAIAPTAIDNCKGNIIGTTTDPLTYSDQGTYIIHWTYDDGNSNISTQTQTVIVDDTLAPDAPVLANVIVGECSGTPEAPTTTDNTSGIITGTTTTVFPITTQGITIVEWTFDDGNGNITTASQNVIVDDITPPVAPALADVTVGECSGTPVAPTTTDNCAGIITGTTSTLFPITAQGTTVVDWTFDDGNGNITTASQNVIVDDITPPVAPALADVLVGECSGTPVAPTTTDNCAGIITGTTSTLFPITAQGTTVVDWTFDDGNGNTTTATQNVIVDDITPPVAPYLADLTIGECSGTPVAPTTTDNCAGIISGTTSTLFPITQQGTTVVTWTFDDGNGNITTASQNVIVEDVTPPVTPVLADVTVGQCSGTPVAPTTTDNCAGIITGTTTTAFPVTQQGTTIVEWVFDDGNGNTTTASQNVIVDDVTPPVAPVLADITVGECSGTPITPTTTDNCAGIILGTTSTLFPITTQGSTVVTWTFDDGHGNITTASQNIIVDDITPPVAPALADVLVGECSGTPVAPTTTDNCAGIITGTATTVFPITQQGTTVVTWTFDDGNGNTTTASQNVIVKDNTPPVTPVLAEVTVGECSGTPEAPTTTDNCAGIITGTTSTVFPITTQGTTVVEWTFDDGNGNTTTASQNVIVDDITPPVAPALADVTLGECSGTPIAPTTTDNCAGILTGTTSTLFPITTQGTTVVIWTFDDGHGNTTTASQNVIVDDFTPPVAPALADVTVGECSGTPEAPTTTDNCAGIITGTTTTAFPITQQGTTVVTWTFDDGNGNTTTASQNVIVKDNTPPVTPVLAEVIVGECSGTPVAPTTMDNCAGIILGTTSTLFPITKQGPTIVEWTFDDGHGNITTARQNIIVEDLTPPIAPPLADVTIGQCSGTPVAPTTTDNCAGIITGTATTVFPITQQGTTVVTWTFDDGNGNITTASQNVIVEDVTPPVTPVLADVTVGQCSGTPVAPTTTDNCAGIITGTTTTAFPITQQGTTIVEWVFDDGNGNTTTASQNVIVKDNTPPVTPVLAEVTVGECSGTPEAPTTTDNCAGIITGTTSTVFPITTQGSTVVTWTFDDGNGNTTTASQNVIVHDNTPPQIIGSIADITIEGCTAAEVTLAVTTVTQLEALGLSISDACVPDNVLSVTHNDIFQGIAPVVVTRTYTISDPSGNTATSIQSITVVDSQKPVLLCPTPLESYQADNGKCTYTVSGTKLDPIEASDNCSVESVTNDYNNTSSLKDAIFPLGRTSVTWTAIDISGNTTSTTYEIVVVDTQNPIISCAIPAINYPSDPGRCSYTVSGTELDPIEASDNCSVKSVINDFTNSSSLKDAVFPLGTTHVNWTVEDYNGNRTNCSYNIIVVDTQKPVITCATPAPGYSHNSFGTELDPIVSDNCSIASITNDFNNSASLANAVFPVGSTVVTWTATDISGNSAVCSYTIVIQDTQPPVINCALVADEYMTDLASNVYEIKATDLDPGVEDNYSEVTLTNNYNNSASLVNARFPVGQTTVIWTATDKSGNTSSCTQIVKVRDLQKPTIICPADINVIADPGNCSVTGLNLGVPITADNCSVTSVENDAPVIFHSGKTVVVWTVTDASGNMATCTQTVTVNSHLKAVNDNVTVKEDEKITENVLTNDEGCKMTVLVQSYSQPTHGSLTMAGDGTFTYIPDNNYFGEDSFTYQACSANDNCSEAMVRIIIESVDDLPQAVDDDQKLELDLVLEGNVSVNDLTSADDGNVWSLVAAPSHGTIDFHPDGTYSYTATTDFLGSDSFTYQLCDKDGDCSQARVSITIEDVLSPNQILTPNGDLINDTFIIEGINLYPDNKLTIYNRWGNVVYRKNNYQNEWDGVANGNKIGSQPLPVGTYYYLIDYGKNRHKTGFVFLDR